MGYRHKTPGKTLTTLSLTGAILEPLLGW